MKKITILLLICALILSACGRTSSLENTANEVSIIEDTTTVNDVQVDVSIEESSIPEEESSEDSTLSVEDQEDETLEISEEISEEEPEEVLSVTYSLGTDKPDNLSEVSIFSCTASSEIVIAGRYNYNAGNIIDGNLKTNWQEYSEPGPGIGEWILLSLREETPIKCMAFYLGYAEDAQGYYQNSRPKDMLLEFGGLDAEISFYDYNGWQYVTFDKPIPLSSLKCTIQSVYAGTEWQDTAITEIAFFAETDSSEGNSSNTGFTYSLVSTDPASGKVIINFSNMTDMLVSINTTPCIGTYYFDLYLPDTWDYLGSGETKNIEFSIDPALFNTNIEIALTFYIMYTDAVKDYWSIGTVVVWEPQKAGSESNAETIYAPARQLIEDFVQEVKDHTFQNDPRFGSGWIDLAMTVTDYPPMYGYTDLDRDGIPEMIVYNSSYPYDMIYAMFTAVSGTPEQIILGHYRASYSTDKYGYLHFIGSNGYNDSTVECYAVSNGQLIKLNGVYSDEYSRCPIEEFINKY